MMPGKEVTQWILGLKVDRSLGSYWTMASCILVLNMEYTV